MAEGSWGEMIRSIEHDKKNLPWDPSKTNPVERVSIYERKREERKFDPVGMRFTDENKEAMFQTDKTDKMKNTSTIALNKKKATWDILAHQGPPRKYEYMCKPNELSGTERAYNLVNGLDTKDHKSVPFQFNEDMINYKIKHRKKNYIHIPVDMNREFSIINNEYNDHSTTKRMQADYDRTKQHVLKQYWSTHDYNPIKGKYYDTEKEKNYQEQGEILRKVQGTAYLAKIPPSVLYSEGLSYNILNNDVYDAKRLVATNTVANLALNRMKVRPVEDRLKKESEAKHLRDESRKLSRPSFKRWKEQIDRGYDVVTNSLHDDLPPPVPGRPASMWARISTEDTNTAQETANKQLNPRINQLHSTAPAGASYVKDVITMPSGQSATGMRNLSGGLQRQPSSPQHNDIASQGSQLTGGDSYQLSPNQRSPSSGHKPFSSIVGASTVPSMSRVGSRQGTAVPSLDLRKASPKEKVTYTEPKGGGGAQPISMVRTGGLSGLRD